MGKHVTLTCPDSGKPTTIAVLADRYGLPVSLVRCRYDQGKRGNDLVRQPGSRPPLDPAKLRAANIERAKRSALALPMREIARASKEVAHHA